MANRDELRIPDIAKPDRNSFEILRVWVNNQGQHLSIRTRVWKDPAYWGMMLADLARHIANAYLQDEGLEPLATLERIMAGLDAELSSPTDEVSGKKESVLLRKGNSFKHYGTTLESGRLDRR